MSKLKDFMSSPFKRKHRNTRQSLASGIRVNRSVGNSIKLHRDSRARKRAEYLATLPKNPALRILYRLHPKRVWGFFTSRHGILLTLKIAGAGIIILIVFTLALFAYFRKDLPKNITDLKTCSEGASTTYYDRTGKTLLWASSGEIQCFPVSLNNVAPYMRDAVIAAEDKDFYKEGAFSTRGILRAGWNDLRGGGIEGGSTITQQFVKNSILTPQQTISRKIKELILAIELERSYSKNDILTAYLNDVPFGSVYDGVEAAARGYFGVPAADLTLDESALLAAVIPAPTYYSPYGSNTDALLNRQHYILDLMAKQGYITQAQANVAKQVNVLAKIVTSHNAYSNIIAPYFVLQVQEQLEQTYGAANVQKAGFKVITTLNLQLQKVAENVVNNTMPKVIDNFGQNMAVDAEDPATGQVLAQVGGRSFDYPGFGQENMATIPRSPGSSFKIYDYSTLMTVNKNWGAGSTLYDLTTDFGDGYAPHDYDFRTPGAESMRYALGQSRNIPAVKAMYIAGEQNVLNMAQKMGITSGVSCGSNPCGLSAAIGDGDPIPLDEHVNGYATLARLGVYKPLTYILQIQDRYGHTIQQWTNTTGTQVLDPQVAYIMDNMLSDPKASYFGDMFRLNHGYVSAMKTGTTNNNEDGWLMGFTPNLVFGLWNGRQTDNQNMYNYTDTILGPAWNSFMTQANQILNIKPQSWTQPAGIKTVCINQITGFATTSGGKCDIFPSWYQPRYPNSAKTAVIDTVSGLLATACTPPDAKETITGGGLNSELPTNSPLYENFIKPEEARYGSAGGNIPTSYDNVHTCGPSGTYVDSPDLPSITLAPATTTSTTLPGQYNFVATVIQGKYPLKTLNFRVDGSIASGGSFDISSYTSCTTNSPCTFPYSYTATAGAHEVTAEVIDTALYDVTSNTEPADYSPVTLNTVHNNKQFADFASTLTQDFSFKTKAKAKH